MVGQLPFFLEWCHHILGAWQDRSWWSPAHRWCIGLGASIVLGSRVTGNHTNGFQSVPSYLFTIRQTLGHHWLHHTGWELNKHLQLLLAKAVGPFTASIYTTGISLCHSFQFTPVPGTNGFHSFPSSGRNCLPSSTWGSWLVRATLSRSGPNRMAKNLHTSCSCCELCFFFFGTPCVLLSCCEFSPQAPLHKARHQLVPRECILFLSSR